MVKKFKNWFSIISFFLLVACLSYSCSQDELGPVLSAQVCPQNSSESMKEVTYRYSVLNSIPRAILAKSKMNSISVVLKEHEDPCYFDLNIVNLTVNTINLRDRYYLKISREAKDEKGDWKPIENEFYQPPAKGPSCGGGVASGLPPVVKKIYQYQSLQVQKIPRYVGDFETDIRFYITLGGYIYYSKPYKGAINKGQFIPIGKM